MSSQLSLKQSSNCHFERAKRCEKSPKAIGGFSLTLKMTSWCLYVLLFCIGCIPDIEWPSSEVPNIAKTALAKHLDIPESRFTLIEAQEKTWNNGAIGCPKEGMMYTQALIPGYYLKFKHGNETFPIHVSANHMGGVRYMVLCKDGKPEKLR